MDCFLSELQQLLGDTETLFIEPLRSALDTIDGKVKKHLISDQEGRRKNDSERFWKNTWKPNFLSYLYLNKRKDRMARAINDEWFRVPDDVTNINALLIKIAILLNRHEVAEAIQFVDKLKLLLSGNARKHRVIAEFEVAYAFQQLGFKFHNEAIARFERIIGSKLYLELVNEGQITENEDDFWKYYTAKSYGKYLRRGSPLEYFTDSVIEERPCRMFQRMFELLDPLLKANDLFVRARSMIELVDGYMKYRRLNRLQDILPFQHGEMDEMVNDALMVQENNLYVLERCGRYFYQKEKPTMEDIIKSIELFKKVVEIADDRHVSWHQMGIAYLAALNSKEPETQVTDISNSLEQLTISRNTTDDHRFSRNRDAADRTFQMRIAAISCFEKAISCVDGACFPYLLNIAKCYRESFQFDTAVDYLCDAQNLLNEASDRDIVELYEEWSRVAEKRANRKNVNELNDVKELVLKALPNAYKLDHHVRYLTRKFYFTVKMQSECCQDNELFRLETYIFRNLQDKRPLDRVILENVLRTTENAENVVWNIIEILYNSRKNNDCYNAFSYLLIISECKVLNLDNQRRNITIELIRRLLSTENNTTSIYEILRAAFPSLMTSLFINQNSELDQLITDICLVARKEDSPGFRSLETAMEEECHLRVTRALTDGQGCILPGENTIDGICSAISNSILILIFIDGDDDEMIHYIKMCSLALSEKQTQVCLVSDNKDTFVGLPYHSLLFEMHFNNDVKAFLQKIFSVFLVS